MPTLTWVSKNWVWSGPSDCVKRKKAMALIKSGLALTSGANRGADFAMHWLAVMARIPGNALRETHGEIKWCRQSCVCNCRSQVTWGFIWNKPPKEQFSTRTWITKTLCGQVWNGTRLNIAVYEVHSGTTFTKSRIAHRHEATFASQE